MAPLECSKQTDRMPKPLAEDPCIISRVASLDTYRLSPVTRRQYQTRADRVVRLRRRETAAMREDCVFAFNGKEAP